MHAFGYIGVRFNQNKLASYNSIDDLSYQTTSNFATLFPFFVGTEDNQSFKSIQIYFIAIMIGSGGAGMLISSLSIIAEMIGQNTQSSAFVYGAISLVDKLSNGKI